MPLVPNIPIDKVAKNPWAYVLIVMGGLIGVLSSNLLNKDKQVIRAYQDRHISDLDRVKKSDSATTFWQNKYFEQVNYTVNIQRKTDSINRETLQKPNTEFTKALKLKRKNEHK